MCNILIVEDEEMIAESIKSRLEMLGYQVPEMLSEGEEVLESVRASQPDLVLMDIRLRGRMDGIVVAKELRSRYDFPIIYLTAYCDDDTLERAKATEPEGFIVKPFSYADLRASIEIALYKHKLKKEKKLRTSGMIESLIHVKDAVVITDRDRRILLMNPMAEEMIGDTERSLKGLDVSGVLTFLDEKTHKPQEIAVDDILASQQVLTYLDQLILSNQDGTQKPVALFIFMVFDSRQEISAIAYIIRDTADFKFPLH